MFWLGEGKFRLVLQAEAAECGLACIAMVASHYGHSQSIGEMRRRYPISLTGSNLQGLMNIADAVGFTSRPVRCELDELRKLEMPCILHWDLDHYVVLKSVSGQACVVADPGRGMRTLQFSEVSKHFTGVALELTPAPTFEPKKKAERVALSDLWSRLSGFLPVLMQLFGLTLLIQVFALLMPVANQMVVDDVIARGDRELLFAILVGFGMFALIQAAIELLRSYIQLFAGQRLALQLPGNLMRHMLRLPISYFERRHVGDVLSRYSSLQPVQTFLTSGITGVLLDALMVIPAMTIMFLYSAKLAGLVLVAIIISLLVEWSAFRRNKRFTDETITLGAKTQSIFLETVRAVRAIKLAGREAERHSAWQNAVTDQQNVSFRQAVMNIWGRSGFGLLMTMQTLFVLYVGAIEIMTSAMTLGMFMAFNSYAGQVSTRAKSLIAQLFEFRMLGLHLERLSDIVHAEPEERVDLVAPHSQPIQGTIEFRGVHFRYGSLDPWVLRGIDFKVAAGDRIALIGPSGGGKSTLMKLMVGLYEPIEGEILIDDVPLKSLGLTEFRRHIGVVMQDDQLLSGTIADNVSFFDPQMDSGQIERACRAAQIHEEILRLPMGYHSLVGDMGSVLSGGQKQRILLARALYRKPRILFLDEGTANLDAELEGAVLKSLKDLGITQIMVAHRKAAIEFCERVLLVNRRAVTEPFKPLEPASLAAPAG